MFGGGSCCAKRGREGGNISAGCSISESPNSHIRSYFKTYSRLILDSNTSMLRENNTELVDTRFCYEIYRIPCYFILFLIGKRWFPRPSRSPWQARFRCK